MQIRRPIAALFLTLALLGGGSATLAGCGDPAGVDRSDGTTDDSKNTSGDEQESEVPDNSNPETGSEDDSSNNPQ
jgi:hypothetical protein